MIRLITAGDRRLMRRINRWHAPLWIRKWMVFASRGGDGWLWSAVGLILFLFGGDRRFEALEAGFVSLGAGQLTFFVLKRLIGRERPCATETHCWAEPAAARPLFVSFRPHDHGICHHVLAGPLLSGAARRA